MTTNDEFAKRAIDGVYELHHDRTDAPIRAVDWLALARVALEHAEARAMVEGRRLEAKEIGCLVTGADAILVALGD